MADVQVEKGFTRFANGLLEALMRAALPARHLRVFMALVRLTYGFNRKRDRIGAQQLANLTELSTGAVRSVLRDLTSWGMITRRAGGCGSTPIVAVVKDYDLWEITTKPAEPVQGDLFAPAPANVTPINAREIAQERVDSIPEPTMEHQPRFRGSEPRGSGGSEQGGSDSKDKKDSSETHRGVCVPDVAKAWPEIQKAFAAYGTPAPKDLTRKRRRMLEARLMEHLDRGLECLVHAVHGYWASAAPANGHWDPKRGSTVRNVFKVDRFADYLDAYDSAVASGAEPPFRTKPQTPEEHSKHGALTARREFIEGLYRQCLLERPDEASLAAWEARGRPTNRAWWDPEGLYVPKGRDPSP